MDKFVVSARKYRPQTFDTVIGQGHITTTLKNAIRNNQLAHAFLFCGPRGVGKTTCARILAKTINCENRTSDGEACNTCASCVSFNEGTSLNIHELDAASNNSVDDIRSLVDQVRFAPQAGKYKVYIIDEVHMLSSSAFNAFLKTLEEPPPYAIFILATTEKHRILPTILSRCQIFDFKKITLSDTVDHLREICKKEHIKAEKAALQVIAQKSEGCLRDALSILDKIVSFTNGEVNYQHTLEHLNILDADYYFKLMECMQSQDLAGAMLLYDEIDRKGFDGELFIDGVAEFFRNLLVCKDERVAGLLEAVESFREKYMATAKEVDAAWLISALNILNEAEINYKSARNKRLHIEFALIKLAYLRQAIELAGTTENGKKKRLEHVKPVAFKKIAPVEFDTPPIARKEAKLLVEFREPFTEPVPERAPALVEEKVAADDTVVAAPRLSMLAHIRKTVADRQSRDTDSGPVALREDSLQEGWKTFTRQLRDKRNPAAQSFENARLRVSTDSSFDVLTNNNLEQKFIEQERITLSEFLAQLFNNKSIVYNIVIDHNAEPLVPTTPMLSTRDQFQKIIEQYPLVKELKDKLRLDLDY